MTFWADSIRLFRKWFINRGRRKTSPDKTIANNPMRHSMRAEVPKRNISYYSCPLPTRSCQ
jgi:hypothetical protein